jgi:hypothetical protein
MTWANYDSNFERYGTIRASENCLIDLGTDEALKR